LASSRYVKKSGRTAEPRRKGAELAPKDIAKQSTCDGPFEYGGVDDNYFMTAVLFPGAIKVSFQPVTIPPPAGSKDPGRDLVSYSVDPAASTEPASSRPPLKFFAGPKDFDVLASIDRELVRAIDFGMFAVLVVPLLRSLKWLNGYVGNYGWSIILLTIIINAIMFPLRHKSVVSMRKMQEIQPEVKSIQDRYAKLKTTDPARQKMNQELMALYRERGVNPASGCVPMLLTMPVLFAFYAVDDGDRAARGAVCWLDSRPVAPRSAATSRRWPWGSVSCGSSASPATGVDPTTEDDDVHAGAVHRHVPLGVGIAIYWLMSNLWGIGQRCI
jgi:YidC/Oxa1 family membrane protein insertase